MIGLLTAVLERALNRYLQLDPESLSRLATLAGKVLKVEFLGWDISCYLFPDEQGVRLQNYWEGPVDATLKGSPLSLLRVGLARDEKTVALASEIIMEGDVELAHRLSQIMQEIDIDWEEPLAHRVGDVLAHQIGNGVRGMKRWGEAVWSSMRNNMTEYLQEESRYLPPRQEIEDFYTDLDTLRNDVERLAMRLQHERLKQAR